MSGFEQDRINKNVNELSQKLLEGCKLLCAHTRHTRRTIVSDAADASPVHPFCRSDSCPETNVPLVSTKDGRMYSVGNGAYYVKEGDELLKVTPAGKENEPVSTTTPVSASLGASPWTGAPFLPSPPQPETESQSLSARVAQKLLEGYQLLSESCPHTSVPLVQHTDGRIYSVGTGKFYTRVGTELRELGSQQVTATGSMPPPQPASVHAHASPRSLGPAPTFATAETVAMPALSFGAPTPARNGDSPTTPAVFSPPPAAVDEAMRASHPVIESTLSVLYHKLEQARLELMRSTTTEAAAPLVVLIKDIAQAIATLKTI